MSEFFDAWELFREPTLAGTFAGALLGVLGIELRNPYSLHRQKAFLVPGVVPPDRVEALEALATWEDWDPDDDHWSFAWDTYWDEAERGEDSP